MGEDLFYSKLIQSVEYGNYGNKNDLMNILKNSYITFNKTGIFTSKSWQYWEKIEIRVPIPFLETMNIHKKYLKDICYDIYEESERYDIRAVEFKPGKTIEELGGKPLKYNSKKTLQEKEDSTTIYNPPKKKVFIVHGRDNETKLEVARFLERIELIPIILHEQASSGMTIIEKIEYYSEESNFGIVLYTPCDKGKGNHENNIPHKNRARQNVVFEHGYLMAKLGRKNVHALVKGDVEKPNDISGLVYSSLEDSNWKTEVCKELKACGYNIDMNKL